MTRESELNFLSRRNREGNISHDFGQLKSESEMRSPHYGESTPQAAAAAARLPPLFQSTVSVQKLRRFNTLILVFRFASFCFCLSSFIFMLTNSRGSSFPNWRDFNSFRYALVANSIVTVYSLFEMGVSVWEILTGNTVLPETLQLWFDFGHDQVFAYMLLTANAAGTAVAWNFNSQDTCTASNAFCIQSYVSIALGFGGFLFLGLSSLLSGFRLVCFIINGSRFHL